MLRTPANNKAASKSRYFKSRLIRRATSSNNRSRGVSSRSRTSGSISGWNRTDLTSNRASSRETPGNCDQNDRSHAPNNAPVVAVFFRKSLLEVGRFIASSIWLHLAPSGFRVPGKSFADQILTASGRPRRSKKSKRAKKAKKGCRQTPFFASSTHPEQRH